MTNQLKNRTPQATCSGDTVGGFFIVTGEMLGALCFFLERRWIMPCHKYLNWGSVDKFSSYKRDVERKIEYFSMMLKNPTRASTKTGRPLLDSTIKTYRSKLELKQREKKWLGDLDKEMDQYDLISYRDAEYPGLRVPCMESPKHIGSWTFLQGLKEARQVAKTNTEYRKWDLMKMLEFILEYENSSRAYIAQKNLCDHIVKVFIEFLDYMIGQDLDETEDSKTETEKRGNVIDLNSRKSFKQA
jgi:hypothetical protein